MHDTVYFHLPSLQNPNQTVFGISCYRQISVDVSIKDKLIFKTRLNFIYKILIRR